MWCIWLWLSADFQFNANFPSQLYAFFFTTVKSPSIAQRSGSQENALKKTNKQTTKQTKNVGFYLRNYRLKYIFFYSNWKQFQVFKMAKFEFKVTVHYGLWTKCTELWPLNCGKHV